MPLKEREKQLQIKKKDLVLQQNWLLVLAEATSEYIATTDEEINSLAVGSLTCIRNKSTAQRPMTSTNKKFQGSMKMMTEDTIKAHEKYMRDKELKNQQSDTKSISDTDNRNSDELINYDYSKTPEVLKHKAKYMQNQNYTYQMVDNNLYDGGYSSVEKKYSKRKEQKNMQDDVDLSTTPASSDIKERSTITPCRFSAKKYGSPFSIGSEAFYQPTTDESENLIVNLEDIVKEEHCIFDIQESLIDHKNVNTQWSKWWDITKDSSVKEMQLFFEEESSK